MLWHRNLRAIFMPVFVFFFILWGFHHFYVYVGLIIRCERYLVSSPHLCAFALTIQRKATSCKCPQDRFADFIFLCIAVTGNLRLLCVVWCKIFFCAMTAAMFSGFTDPIVDVICTLGGRRTLFMDLQSAARESARNTCSSNRCCRNLLLLSFYINQVYPSCSHPLPTWNRFWQSSGK